MLANAVKFSDVCPLILLNGQLPEHPAGKNKT